MSKEKGKKQYIEFPLFPVKMRKFTGYTLSFNNDGTPRFTMPQQNAENLTELIERLNSLFKSDGTFNPDSSKAEEYAICLENDGKHKAAMELFTDIVGNSTNVLAVNDDSSVRDWICHPVARKHGKLGYIGAICYVRLCLKEVNKEKEHVGLQIAKEIAVKIPQECVPFGLQSVLIEALDVFIKRNIKLEGIDLIEKVGYVREQQHSVY